jgi:putative transposase
MKDMYVTAQISKQAFWKRCTRIEQQLQVKSVVVDRIRKARANHKRMSCRKIYRMVQHQSPVGRDIFEQIGFANGYKLKIKRSPIKTTWSQRIEVFPNLIEGKTITNINQVWQSDIFYLMVGRKVFYGVTIEDVYSRRVLALHFSKSLKAEETVKALKKAILARQGLSIEGCIFHSDRGSQYISQMQKNMLQNHSMQISMCKYPQENAYVERVQGTLKHEYLNEFDLQEDKMNDIAKRILKLYNLERPHDSLKWISPIVFEKNVSNLNENERPKMQIFKWASSLLTNTTLINKKEKRTKKEKNNTNTNTIFKS